MDPQQQQQQQQQQAVVSPPTPSTSTVNKRPVKFVGSDHDGLPLKRRQVQQACDSCRKKKKRCLHGSATTGFSFIHNTGLSHQHHQHPQRRPQWSPTSQPQQEPPPSSSSQQPNAAAPSSSSSSRPGNSTTTLLPLSPASTDEASSSTAPPTASQLVEVSAQRFVGDLSPESVLIEATNRESVELRLQRNRSEVGGWMREAGRAGADGTGGLEPGHDGRGGKARAAAAAAEEEKQPVGAPVTFGGRLQRHHQPDHDAVEEQRGHNHHLAVLPPEHEYQQLLIIYLDQNHPILPIIKRADALATRWPASPRQIVFKQGIALVAALEPAASKLLRLKSSDATTATIAPLLSAEDYHQRLSTAIFASLDAGVLADRVDHIRMLLLMSFYYQPRAAAERDFSPLIFSQAVHYALGLGLHLCEYGRGDDEGNAPDAECLFCILWALDRLNASFHGRPCYLHHRDTDRELDECIAKQELPAFRLFLGVAKMLDRVIHLYRPRNDGVESVEMPIFESMIIQAGAERVPSRLLSTVEIFYHAVSLLSCRESSATTSCPTPSSPQPQPQLPQKHRSSSSSTVTTTTSTTTTPTPTTRPSSTAHLPHPTLNARRSLSADRIVDAVLAAPSTWPSPPNNPHNNEISLLPFVAYAVALALSVAYQKMRYSRIPMYRSRARARFEEIVALLQRIGAIYTGARVNAALGVLILREMDKTAKTLVGGSSSSTSGGASDAAQSHSGGGGGEGAGPAAVSVAGPTSQREEEMRRASSVSYGQAPPLRAQQAQAQAQDQGAAAADSSQQQQQQQGVTRRQQYFTSPVAAAERVPDDGLLTPFASSSSQSQQGANTPEDISAAMGAPPSWGDLSDIDLFVHFDPGFDLSAVDTALVGNLEMGLPTWMMPWPE